jgi:hypothetical protein
MGLSRNGAEVRLLFDENRVPPFEAISKTRVRSGKVKSGNIFEIFGLSVNVG